MSSLITLPTSRIRYASVTLLTDSVYHFSPVFHDPFINNLALFSPKGQEEVLEADLRKAVRSVHRVLSHENIASYLDSSYLTFSSTLT